MSPRLILMDKHHKAEPAQASTRIKQKWIFRPSVITSLSLTNTTRRRMSRSFQIRSKQCFMHTFYRCSANLILRSTRTACLKREKKRFNSLVGTPSGLQIMQHTSWMTMMIASTSRKCSLVVTRELATPPRLSPWSLLRMWISRHPWIRNREQLMFLLHKTKLHNSSRVWTNHSPLKKGKVSST